MLSLNQIETKGGEMERLRSAGEIFAGILGLILLVVTGIPSMLAKRGKLADLFTNCVDS